MYAVFKQLLDNYIGSLHSDSSSAPAIPGDALVVYTQNFTLTDDKSCGSCSSSQECDNVVMVVKTDHPVGVFHVETCVAVLPPKTRQGLKNCDFILCDDNNRYSRRKVALCDLSCIQERYLKPGQSRKYPQGKRQYVVGQMVATANFLAQDAMLGHTILTATDKQLVFGVRINNQASSNKTMDSMKAFSRTPSSQAGTVSSRQTIAGVSFDYVEVRYPEALRW